jgi:hypothetical protein
MKHIGGSMQSPYMPPPGEFLFRIGLAGAMVAVVVVP